jgi:NADPH:quinone reductase-like Zn-dependent oxidoreductase
MFALKLARAAGLKVVLTSSSDKKLEDIRKQFPEPPIMTINYAQKPVWHEEVLRLTDGVGVDLVIEVGGTSTLLKSMKCTRRGGTISQVGYLSKQAFENAEELLPTIIDRRISLR